MDKWDGERKRDSIDCKMLVTMCAAFTQHHRVVRV